MRKKNQNEDTPTILRIYLIKENYEEDKIIKDSCYDSLTEYSLNKELEIEGRLFFREKLREQPKWFSLIKQIVSDDTNQLTLQNSYTPSGVIFLDISERLFAICFGYGYTFLNEEFIEIDFGIKTTLNLINPEKVRSLRSKSLELTPIEIERKTIHSIDLKNNYSDTDNQLLRSISGIPLDNKKIKLVSGTQSVCININTSPKDFKNICKELLSSYQSSSYVHYFGWVDKIKIIRDPKEIEFLTSILISDFNNKELEQLSFYPTIFSENPIESLWYISGYKIHSSYVDPEISISMIRSMFFLDNISFDDLKNTYIQIRNDNGDIIGETSLFKSLIFEYHKNQDDIKILSEGIWYNLDKNFYQRINSFYTSLTKSVNDLFLSSMEILL